MIRITYFYINIKNKNKRKRRRPTGEDIILSDSDGTSQTAVTVAGVNRWQFPPSSFFFRPPPHSTAAQHKRWRNPPMTGAVPTCQIIGRDAFTSLETSPGKPCRIIQVWGISRFFSIPFLSKILVFFFPKKDSDAAHKYLQKYPEIQP